MTRGESSLRVPPILQCVNPRDPGCKRERGSAESRDTFLQPLQPFFLPSYISKCIAIRPRIMLTASSETCCDSISQNGSLQITLLPQQIAKHMPRLRTRAFSCNHAMQQRARLLSRFGGSTQHIGVLAYVRTRRV